MSLSPAASQSGSKTQDPEEVIRLVCPQCSGKLNLRRKHLGIAGACVHCKIPVTAIEEGGTVKLVDNRKDRAGATAEKPAEGKVIEPAKKEPDTPPASEAPTQEPSQEPPVHQAPSSNDDATADACVDTPPPVADSVFPAKTPVEQAPVEQAPVSALQKEVEPLTAGAKPTNGSAWGFPDREETPRVEDAPESAPSPASEVQIDPEPAPAEEPSSFDFSSLPEGTPPPWEEILSNSGKGNASIEKVQEVSPEVPSESPEDEPLETASMDSVEDESPSFDQSSPPSTESEEMISAPANEVEKDEPVVAAKDDPFEFDAMPEQSALFNSKKEEVGVNSGWGTKVPIQNHASISPFATGSATPESANDAVPGFAETLFKEKPASRNTSTIEPKSPFGETSSDDSSSAAPSPFAQIGAPPSSDEPVVLDGDGRPMAPMTDEQKDTFAREMMQLGDFHKRSPWLKRIRRFIITVAVLAGVGYAAYLFLPAEMAKDYKNKALTFLEPGSVLLDFLPVEIVDDPDGEEGDKTFKVKAIDGLNQMTDQMDGYLNAADQNLRESGATVEEREKIEHMDQPNIPKLPFKVDLEKLKPKDGETAEAPPIVPGR